MKKQFVVLAVTLLMVFASIVPALTAEGAEGEGFLVLEGGNLTVTPASITFAAFILDGTDHDNVVGTTAAWNATDATGSGLGWHVTIAATVPTNAGSKTIATAGFEMELLDTAITFTDGNTKPISYFNEARALGATQTLVSAAIGEGMGSYTLAPTFTLDVPAETYAGTYYTIVFVQNVSAP